MYLCKDICLPEITDSAKRLQYELSIKHVVKASYAYLLDVVVIVVVGVTLQFVTLLKSPVELHFLELYKLVDGIGVGGFR